jgi:hypothetical protein
MRVKAPVAPSLTVAVFESGLTVTPVVVKSRIPPARKGLKSTPWIVFDASTAVVTKWGLMVQATLFGRSKTAIWFEVALSIRVIFGAPVVSVTSMSGKAPALVICREERGMGAGKLLSFQEPPVNVIEA